MQADRLVGRDVELVAIADAIARAAAGTPTLVLVEGEPGGGKTALLRSLQDSPLLPRRRVRIVALDLSAGGDPVGLAAGQLTGHAAFEKLGGRRRALAAFRKVLPDWISAIPGWGDLLEAITTTAAALRRRRKGAREAKPLLPEDIEDLQIAARRRPTALLIDGAEAIAPAPADRLFQLLDTAEVGTRLLVIAAFRPGPPGAPPRPVVRALDRLPSARRTRIALRALGEDDVARWLEIELGGSVSAALVSEVMEATGGLPVAIAAHVRALQERDALRRVEEGWIAVVRDEAEPVAPAEAAAIDLGPLGADVRDVLSAGALRGDSFDALTLAHALERDELWIEDRLAAATRLGVLHLIDDAHEMDGEITSLYRFASAAVRAALRRELAPARRAALEELWRRA